MEIKKIGQIARDAGVKAIIHGASGSGKTYSISTLPDHAGVLVLSAEAGLMSIRKAAAGIDAAEITTMDHLREAHEALKADTNYHTIVLDSLSEIAQVCLSDELKKTADPRKAYGEMGEKMMKVTRAFRDLPGKNVILICQQEKLVDSEGRIYYGPAMPGKSFTGKLPYFVDLIGCIRIKVDESGEVKRALQCQPVDEMYLAKDRSGNLDTFESVNWTNIFNKIKGE